jgi:DNA-binding CsgD family transcriptional regulator
MRLVTDSIDRTPHGGIAGVEPVCALGVRCPCRVMTSPRHRQTLHRLMEGDSEKQVARYLGISQHTVHVYIKHIFRTFSVSSRGELMAQILLHYEQTILQWRQWLRSGPDEAGWPGATPIPLGGSGTDHWRGRGGEQTRTAIAAVR